MNALSFVKHALSNIFKHGIAVLLAAIVFSAGTVNAQPVKQGNSSKPALQQSPQQGSEEIPYSDKELKKFAKIVKETQSIRRSGRQKLVKKVKASDLDVKTFQKLEASKKRGGKLPDSTSKAERQSYKQLKGELEKVQKNIKKEMDASIKENGMKKKKFMEMAQTMRQNKAMQQKVQKLSQS